MTGEDLKAWRERLRLTKQDAANLLGLHRSTIDAYERGMTRGKKGRPSTIPKHIGLACAAIAHGIPSY